MTRNGRQNGEIEKTVLVVEDEDAIRRIICRICKGLGLHRILDAANVESALKLLNRERIDLVITDLNMPDATGLAIVKVVRQAKPHVPVLVFSGSYNETERKRLLAAGADMVLRKSADLLPLEAAIRELLQIGPRRKPGPSSSKG